MDKKFLHKVVNQLVNETKIDYERERIDLTSSATRWSFPPLSIPAPVHLPSYTFYNHCKDMYGLTSEETEYVWMQYRKVIKDKIKKTMNINESAGTNQKDYFDKVINQLVSETEIDYENTEIDAPFLLCPLLLSSFPSSASATNFFKYCRNIYGLTEEETEYVWIQYRKIIKDKIKNKPLNESTEDNALNKIVDQLVSETEIDYENTEIDASFITQAFLLPSSFYLFSSSFFPYFFKYCRNIYGLTEEETEYVWIQYRKIIKDKIKNKPLNESTEDNALNKIVDQLMDETDIDYGRKLVLTPFWVRPFSFPFSIASRSFIRHCRDIYGLNVAEKQYVWDKYKKIIKNKIKNKPLNESTEDNALNKIVDQLVSETEIDYKNKEIDAPFIFITTYSLPPPYSPFPFPPSSPFINHCRNVYGLTSEETQKVWDKYKKIIKYKIKNG